MSLLLPLTSFILSKRPTQDNPSNLKLRHSMQDKSLMPTLSVFSDALTRWLALVLPSAETRRQETFNLSAHWHIIIALMLNILSLAVPIMMLQVYDRIIPHQAYGTLTILVGGVLIALAFDAVLRLARAWLSGWAAASHEHAAACAVMERFANVKLHAFEQNSAGTYMQNFGALDRLREFYSGQSLTALVDLPFVLLFLLLIVYLGGWLVLAPLILIVIFVAFSQNAGNWLKNAIKERGEADDRKASHMIAVLSGIHTVKSLAMESLLLRRFEYYQKDVTEGSYNVALASGFAATMSAAFSQLSLIITASVGTIMVLNGHLSVGGLSACTMLAGRALQPVQRVLGTWLRMQDLAISSEQAKMLFALPMQQRSAEALPPPKGKLLLQGVDFSYNDETSFALKGVSFNVEPGEVVTIAGEKGSGKSTLLQVMVGLLTPTHGTVQLDGFDPATHSMSEMQGHIGYLSPQGIILKGSILDNMTGFRNDDASIASAKEMGHELGLDSVINLLPRGYATLLADNAADPVPPGVKQRIVLTRILRHRPAMLMFDHADRALDKEGYNRLFRLMGKLKGTCSIVMVSHDQNLLSFADRSYILDKGLLREVDPSDVQSLSLLVPPRGDE
jgi:ATP-binding cassette subfamily C protein LapB